MVVSNKILNSVKDNTILPKSTLSEVTLDILKYFQFCESGTLNLKDCISLFTVIVPTVVFVEKLLSTPATTSKEPVNVEVVAPPPATASFISFTSTNLPKED